jgi:branched-chain amino acid transport system substrate-binding protein
MRSKSAITKVQAIIVAIIIVIAAVASGLGGYYIGLQQGAGAGVGGPAPPRVIKIGATVPLTGPNAPAAGWTEKLYKTWAKMINERYGGIYVKEYGTCLPVEFVIYDSKSDPATSAKFYEKLILDDKCDFLLGPYADPECAAVIPITNKYEYPLLIGCGGAPDFYKAPNKWVTISTDVIANFLKEYASFIKEQGFKTVGIIYTDEPFAVPVRSGFIHYLSELGGIEITVDEKAAVGTTDWSAQISKLKNANPDVTIFASIYSDTHVSFFKQMKELGFTPKVYCAVPAECFVPALGWAATEGCTSTTMGVGVINPVYDGPWGRAFLMDLIKELGINAAMWPDVFGPDYGTLEILYLAIEQAGTLDREKVNEAIRNLYYMSSVMGVNYYIKDYSLMEWGRLEGVYSATWWPIQVQNGKWVIIYGPYKTGQFRP